MEIIGMDYCSVEIKDEQGLRSTVFHEDNGAWKCLRCGRRRCEHALFVGRANPAPPPALDIDIADYADLIDE